jgi:hypothetical protein
MADEASQPIVTIVSTTNEGGENVESETNNAGSESITEGGSSVTGVDGAEAGTPPANDVAIAEIEANRDITIEAIRAEVDTARIETIAEERSEIELCREEIKELRELVSTLETRLIPPPPPPMEQAPILETVEPLEIAPETSSIPNDTPTPILETQTELSEERREEKPEAQTRARRTYIAI